MHTRTHKIQTIKRLVKQVNVCKIPFTIKKPTKIPIHHWVCFILVILLVWCLIWRVFNVHIKSHSNFFCKQVPIAGNILGMENYASLMLLVLGCHLAWTCAGFVYTLCMLLQSLNSYAPESYYVWKTLFGITHHLWFLAIFFLLFFIGR